MHIHVVSIFHHLIHLCIHLVIEEMLFGLLLSAGIVLTLGIQWWTRWTYNSCPHGTSNLVECQTLTKQINMYIHINCLKCYENTGTVILWRIIKGTFFMKWSGTFCLKKWHVRSKNKKEPNIQKGVYVCLCWRLYICMFVGVLLGKDNNMCESPEVWRLQCIYKLETTTTTKLFSVQ